MKLIVTGGAGFIGSAVIRHLIQNTEHHVMNVDKLTYAGNLDSLLSVADSPRYQFAQLDIVDATAMNQLFQSYQPDAIMHLAAESHVDRSIDKPAEFVLPIMRLPHAFDQAVIATAKVHFVAITS